MMTDASQLKDVARTLSSQVAREVFNINPLYDAQIDVLERLALMRFSDSNVTPSSVLLIHPTGGGKSLVCDVYHVLFRGVTLTIVPILALGSDQKVKIQNKAVQNFGRVISIHIDEVRDTAQANDIIKEILSLPSDTTKSILLFASPQALVTKSNWKQFIIKLIDKKMLRLVAVDEVQLFVHYGLSFRKEFAMLSATMFNHMKIGNKANRLKLPVLFMTATCNQHMITQLETRSQQHVLARCKRDDEF